MVGILIGIKAPVIVNINIRILRGLLQLMGNYQMTLRSIILKVWKSKQD